MLPMFQLLTALIHARHRRKGRRPWNFLLPIFHPLTSRHACAIKTETIVTISCAAKKSFQATSPINKQQDQLVGIRISSDSDLRIQIWPSWKEVISKRPLKTNQSFCHPKAKATRFQTSKTKTIKIQIAVPTIEITFVINEILQISAPHFSRINVCHTHHDEIERTRITPVRERLHD